PTATTDIYTLSLHDALPISPVVIPQKKHPTQGDSETIRGAERKWSLLTSAATKAGLFAGLLSQKRGVHGFHRLLGFGQLNHHGRSEEHTSELQSRFDLVCRL